MIFSETSSTGGSTLIPGDTPRSSHSATDHHRTGMTRPARDLPDLRSFTCGLTRDHDAVLAGLTLQHSSGAVEGNVNRIKMIKRQMYGRAGFALLRKRVLLAT